MATTPSGGPMLKEASTPTVQQVYIHSKKLHLGLVFGEMKSDNSQIGESKIRKQRKTETANVYDSILKISLNIGQCYK